MLRILKGDRPADRSGQRRDADPTDALAVDPVLRRFTDVQRELTRLRVEQTLVRQLDRVATGLEQLAATLRRPRRVA